MSALPGALRALSAAGLGKCATESLLGSYSILPGAMCLPQTGADIGLPWKVDSSVLVPVRCTLSVSEKGHPLQEVEWRPALTSMLVVESDSVMGTVMTTH